MPEYDTIQECAPLMPHLVDTTRSSEVGARYANLNRSFARVDWKISRTPNRGPP